MKKALVGLLVLLLLGGGGFAAWWFYFKPPPPDQSEESTDADVEADDAADAGGASEDSTSASEGSNENPSTAGLVKAGDMSRLVLPEFKDWKGTYDRFLHSWTFVYTTPEGKEGPKGTGRFYVGRMPDAAPRDMHTYAKRLREDAEFQDIGYVYDEVDDTEVYDDGWLILGKAKDTTRPDEAALLSFVVYRAIGGAHIRCRGSDLHTTELRTAAINACRRATFQ